MSILVDTSVLFAAASPRDRSHDRARAILEHLAGSVAFTTDHVVVETWNLLMSRFGRVHAMRFWTALRGTPLRLESVGPSDMERGLSIAEGWPDQTFDIVDCTTFATMERLGCRRAATFDSDFSIYRFGPDRRYAFEIIA